MWMDGSLTSFRAPNGHDAVMMRSPWSLHFSEVWFFRGSCDGQGMVSGGRLSTGVDL